ncbi:aldose 1-epimerase [Sphingomonas ginkgonis]|uniref:Aldose 1-epimerase n=1 Tax=Sphingomonas ginkgonis TaxID=2315330 RepID=A0A3R9WML3_9SPHN|nr:aldose 1-epimerase [Sphingomonas ginkgonis]RST30008.1 aldose 1-epimerase [Sphingomonas ginkgonis]
MSRLHLSAGPLTLDLAPQHGGAIARFDHGGRPVMRPAPDATEAVLEMASFPLVPFVNRIRDGRFRCGGVTVELAPNMANDPSPLHGQGWLSEWTVVEADDESAVLAYRHEPGEWPWRYDAVQRFMLDPTGLFVLLTCRNLSDTPMPCGLGIHPYFPCDGETLLDTGVTAAWTIDDKVLPVERVPAEGRFDLRQRRICGQNLDNGFDGWNGQALLRWSDGLSCTIRSSDARYFQVYSPATGGIVVAEPVQHANAALNEPEERWAELGIVMLAPGDERSISVRFEVAQG